MFISKNRKRVLSSHLNKKKYTINEAFEDMKKSSYVKFDESVDIAVKVVIDTKKSDQLIRGTVVLPNGNGVSKKILAICNSVDEKACLDAGAAFAGSDEYIKKIEEGWSDFDVIVTIPSMMIKLGRLGKVLGPKGLMPNPKTGGVTTDIVNAIKEIKRGRVEFKNDKGGVIHNCIGKLSFETSKLVENFNSFVDTLKKSKPSSVKGNFIKNISVSSTMGFGYSIDYVG